MKTSAGRWFTVTSLFVGLALTGPSASAQDSCEYPGVLLVVDRSTSMKGRIGDRTKWDIATEAIDLMVHSHEDEIYFGLMIYPGPSGTGANGIEGEVPACFGGVDCTPDAPQCTTGEVVVDIGPSTADGIVDALVFPDGLHDSYTPTWQSLEAASRYAPLHNPFRRNFVVVITDGWQCCGVYRDDDGNLRCTAAGSERDIPVEKVRRLREQGITTYVIGFGASVDAQTLNQMAVEGGTALDGCDPDDGRPCYYQADNHDQLTTFLDEIGRKISEEICDGRDNDCDDQIDEDLTRPCETPCGVGVERCIGPDIWGECDAPQPQPERCNDLDDDCDGQTDEGNPDGGAPCGTNEGVCEFGTMVCRGGQLVCEGGVEPGIEECNGLDDDCDGQTDEGCDCQPGDTRPCGSDVGTCEAGVQTCVDGQWGPCEGAVGPQPETCDGLDNDCDGTVDTIRRACATQCGAGQEICLDGQWMGCDAPQPSMERCNGEDDDCDGQTDEELTQPCNNGCQGEDGVERCVDGQWQDCDARTPLDEEVCGDGLDNDCDGQTEEGCVCEDGDTQPCGSSLGDCEPGVQTCEHGEWSVCRGGRMPQEEVCDGHDNDCDGQTDEATDQPCSNDCGEGIRRCEDGVLGPCSVPDPPEEVCDGLDNDCDEQVDEGDLCEAGLACRCGGCVGECLQGECPPGAECIDGYCVTDNCPDGYHCEGVVCVPGEGDGGEQPGGGGDDDQGGGGSGGFDGDNPAPTDDCGCQVPAHEAAGRAVPLLLVGLFLLTRRSSAMPR